MHTNTGMLWPTPPTPPTPPPAPPAPPARLCSARANVILLTARSLPAWDISWLKRRDVLPGLLWICRRRSFCELSRSSAGVTVTIKFCTELLSAAFGCAATAFDFSLALADRRPAFFGSCSSAAIFVEPLPSLMLCCCCTVRSHRAFRSLSGGRTALSWLFCRDCSLPKR